MQKDFLRLLLLGDYFGEMKDIDRAAEALGIRANARAYLCLLLCADTEYEGADDAMRAYQRLCEGSQSFFSQEGFGAYAVLLDSGRMAVILAGDCHVKVLEHMLNRFVRFLKKNRLQDICVAVGNAVENLSRIRSSYLSALSAWQSSGFEQEKRVVFCQDAETSHSVSTLQPFSDFEEVIRRFHAGDLNGIQEIITNGAEMTRSRSRVLPNAPYPTSIKRMFVELTVYILHIASDAGVDVDELLDHIDPYTYIMHIDSTPHLIEYFMNLCNGMNRAIREKAAQNENSLIESACAYIGAHLAEYDLGLEKVSESLRITPSYLSKLFQREKNVNFRVYLTHLRMELASSMLTNTRHKIVKIAEETGFSSPHYFCASFRKHTGMTPGEYRRANAAQAQPNAEAGAKHEKSQKNAK